MEPDYAKLRKEFKDAPNVLVAEVDCTQHESICGEQGIQGYPSLKVFRGGRAEDYQGARDFNGMKRYIEQTLNPMPACSLASREACSAKDRAVLEESEKMSKAERNAKVKEVEGAVAAKKQQAKDLEKEAKELAASLTLIKAGGEKVEKVEQLLEDAEFRAHCEDRTCLLAFLPHILDSQASGRNAELKMLDEAFKASQKGPTKVGFLWSQGGDQFEMEEALGLQFGFPAIIAINFKKERFAIHRGAFQKDSITQFLTSLSRGGASLAPIPKNLKIAKMEPWDGKDGQLPQEEEL